VEKRIGNYTILRELARGGMGVVFVARQDGLEREVALKLHLGAAAGDKDDSPKEARARERFDREAHAVARLRHPHVIQVHEFGHHRGMPYLAMDLIQGESLEERLGREGAQEPLAALRLLAPVAEAVAYAHAQGILHRDIKPANILIDREGRPFLTDFGLARDLSDERDRLTRSGQLLGTPYYMAPEAAAGSTSAIDARTDVYALGAVLFQTLTGEPAFVGDSLIELLRSIVSDPVTPPSQVRPGVPPELDAVVLQCLEKEPQHRYADAGELAADLARFTQGEPVSASRSSLSRGLRRISASRAWLAIPLLIALLVLGVVLDRAWLAPARAAERALQAELTWQRETLRPTLYGLDPRHTLDANPGDLRRRLDELEQLPPSVDPALRLEARGYLAAYAWLLERSRGRRRTARALEVVPGRPDVAVRAVVLAESGDLAGAQRLLAKALPDAPGLRATELALLARYESVRFLASGPDEGELSELKRALLPLAARSHFRDLLGDGLSGGQVEFRRRLREGQERFELWKEPGAAAASGALAEVLAGHAARYAKLHELDAALALERLDRLRLCWQSVRECSLPESIKDNLLSSLEPCLSKAMAMEAEGSDAERAFEVDLCLYLLTGQLHSREKFQVLAVLFSSKANDRPGNTWAPGPRSLAAVARHGRTEPERALEWISSQIRAQPTLCDELRELYPALALNRYLPTFDPRRSYSAAELSLLGKPASGVRRSVLHCLRHLTARHLLDAVRARRLEKGRALAALKAVRQAMNESLGDSYSRRWRAYDADWCVASLGGEAGAAETALQDLLTKVRDWRAEGLVGDHDTSRALMHTAKVLGRTRGEPLLQEAQEVSPDWRPQLDAIRAGWR
jgi:predicted Ser/Thr protein kinase